MESTREWLYTAFHGLVAFVPRLIAGLVILAVGYLIAKLLARATRSLATRFGFDRLVGRLGLLDRRADPMIGSRWLAGGVFALVLLVTLVQAARAWGLTFVAEGLGAILSYVPHALAAALIFGVALYLGNWARDRLQGVRMGEGGYNQFRLLPSIVRGLILGAGGFMALRELQIAPEIVNAAFILTLGAVAVATAIAFGLGGRDVAREISQSWYAKRRGVSMPYNQPPYGRPYEQQPYNQGTAPYEQAAPPYEGPREPFPRSST